jgi:hypothetical protein
VQRGPRSPASSRAFYAPRPYCQHAALRHRRIAPQRIASFITFARSWSRELARRDARGAGATVPVIVDVAGAGSSVRTERRRSLLLRSGGVLAAGDDPGVTPLDSRLSCARAGTVLPSLQARSRLVGRLPALSGFSRDAGRRNRNDGICRRWSRDRRCAGCRLELGIRTIRPCSSRPFAVSVVPAPDSATTSACALSRCHSADRGFRCAPRTSPSAHTVAESLRLGSAPAAAPAFLLGLHGNRRSNAESAGSWGLPPALTSGPLAEAYDDAGGLESGSPASRAIQGAPPAGPSLPARCPCLARPRRNTPAKRFICRPPFGRRLSGGPASAPDPVISARWPCAADCGAAALRALGMVTGSTAAARSQLKRTATLKVGYSASYQDCVTMREPRRAPFTRRDPALHEGLCEDRPCRRSGGTRAPRGLAPVREFLLGQTVSADTLHRGSDVSPAATGALPEAADTYRLRSLESFQPITEQAARLRPARGDLRQDVFPANMHGPHRRRP